MRARIALVVLVAFALASATAVGSTDGVAGDRHGADAAKKKKRCASGKKGKRCRHRARCARKPAKRRPKSCRALKQRQGSAGPAPKPGDPGPGPGPGPGDPPGDPTPPPLGHSMSVTAREFTLAPSRAALGAGGQTIELRNWGEDPHNLVISPDDGSHEPLYTWPETPSLELFTMDTTLGAGRYLLWCSLEGHEALGMKTTVRVE